MLCSDRVGQVTKTYHDIKAVTHLLEEVRGRHTADEWDYRGLKLSASLTSAVSHPFQHTYFCQCHQKSHLETFGKTVKWIWSFFCQTNFKKMLYEWALSCKINVTFMYHFAERAGSRVSSTDRSVPPETESRTDDPQWNTGWTAWNCKGRGINKPHYLDTPAHSHWNTWSMWISYSLLSSSDASLLHFSRSLNFVTSSRCETTSFNSTQALRRLRTLSHTHREFTCIVFSMF